MRKIICTGLSAAMLGIIAVSSYASFASVAKSTMTASVSFSGTGTVAVSIEIRNRANDALSTGLTWNTNNDIVPGTTQWKAADQYIVLLSTIVAATGGVQIYTDNLSADMTHPYTGVSTAAVAGLVGWSSTSPSLSSLTLPMCWRIVDTPTSALNIQRGAPGFPDRLWEQSLGNSYPCFLWMKDKSSGPAGIGLQMGLDYITVKDKSRGIQFAETSFGAAVSPDYLYIGADFSTAVNNADYATVVRIEAFTE